MIRFCCNYQQTVVSHGFKAVQLSSHGGLWFTHAGLFFLCLTCCKLLGSLPEADKLLSSTQMGATNPGVNFNCIRNPFWDITRVGIHVHQPLLRRFHIKFCSHPLNAEQQKNSFHLSLTLFTPKQCFSQTLRYTSAGRGVCSLSQGIHSDTPHCLTSPSFSWNHQSTSGTLVRCSFVSQGPNFRQNP